MGRWFARLALLLFVATFTPACGRDASDIKDLTVTEAEAGLRSSATFTTRPGSSVRRELVSIVAIRRIGRSSTEVEFTWHDEPSPATGDAPARTSMALFRLRDTGVWALASLYKVN
jgi:hypothetical protein